MQSNTVLITSILLTIGLLGIPTATPAKTSVQLAQGSIYHVPPSLPSSSRLLGPQLMNSPILKCDDCWSGYGETGSAGQLVGASVAFTVPSQPGCNSSIGPRGTYTDFTAGLDGSPSPGHSTSDFAAVYLEVYCSSGLAHYALYWTYTPYWGGFPTVVSAGDNLTLSTSAALNRVYYHVVDHTTHKSSFVSAKATGANLSAAECVTDRYGAVGSYPFSTFSPTRIACKITTVAPIGNTSGNGLILWKYVAYDSTGTYPLEKVSKVNSRGQFTLTFLKPGP